MKRKRKADRLKKNREHRATIAERQRKAAAASKESATVDNENLQEGQVLGAAAGENSTEVTAPATQSETTTEVTTGEPILEGASETTEPVTEITAGEPVTGEPAIGEPPVTL